ncbi:uncharacterized protein LOC124135753 isoform X1 [Haliotis rufescens]|uniref:uncharacterized protein LOC124135753 isoform X1 n=2 Tax=Haliotis rufescens TaxID=6454 RepID=UPI001EAFA84F|nr:uncharacterized protein LOC124135753 isoform X1 [Haliotis rufescens]XP_048252248.1 uncharacterized protein LOC124135753 isoform X1 [Haliotis rufescens]
MVMGQLHGRRRCFLCPSLKGMMENVPTSQGGILAQDLPNVVQASSTRSSKGHISGRQEGSTGPIGDGSSMNINISEAEPPLKKARYCDIVEGVNRSSHAQGMPSGEKCQRGAQVTNGGLVCVENCSGTRSCLEPLKHQQTESDEIMIPCANDKTVSAGHDMGNQECERTSLSGLYHSSSMIAQQSDHGDSSMSYPNGSGSTDTTDVSDDDITDASNLVLSVIKTKVDIQTMKLCLQHNAESRSNRLSTPAPSVPGAVTGACSTVDASLNLGSLDIQPSTSSGSISGHRIISEAAVEEPSTGESQGQSVQCLEPRGSPQCRNTCICNNVHCQMCNVQRQAQLFNPPNVPDIPDQGAGHLEHWQDQHTAKAIVDNAINRTIEEMVIAPDPPNIHVRRADFENEGVLLAIRDQGLSVRNQQPIQNLHDRLEPVINQLTQASELVFARNIEQSRTTPTIERQFDDTSYQNSAVHPHTTPETSSSLGSAQDADEECGLDYDDGCNSDTASLECIPDCSVSNLGSADTVTYGPGAEKDNSIHQKLIHSHVPSVAKNSKEDAGCIQMDQESVEPASPSQVFGEMSSEETVIDFAVHAVIASSGLIAKQNGNI